MKADLVITYRTAFEDGHILQVVVWKTPENVPPTEHGFKYRLFYGRAGERIVGYDNERGKGDHRHLRSVEVPYHFVSISQLLSDFEADVKAERGENQ